MGKRVGKILITALLVIGLLSCSFSVFAVDEEPEEVLNIEETMMSYYIWLCMRAWGIQISYQDSLEWQIEVGQEINNWVLEYLDSLPSAYTISTWIAPWQASFDYWGNYKFNNSMLEDVQDFVDWLVVKLGLTDNTTQTIDAVQNIGIYSLYDTNTWYQVVGTNGGTAWAQLEIERISGLAPYWFVWNGSYVILSTSSILGTYDFKRILSENQNVQHQEWNFRFQNQDGIYYWEYLNIGAGQNNYIPVGCHQFEGTRDELKAFLREAQIIVEGNVKVITTVINLPDDDSSYTPGDGIIIVDDEPVYEELTFNGEVTNLPAIVSTGELENPEIDQIYTNIPALVVAATESLEIFQQIIWRMPDGVLIALYALLSAGVIFGFLRIMREH